MPRIPVLHFITLLLIRLSRVTTCLSSWDLNAAVWFVLFVDALLYIGRQAPRFCSSSNDCPMKNLSLDPILNDRLLQGLISSCVTSCSRKAQRVRRYVFYAFWSNIIGLKHSQIVVVLALLRRAREEEADRIQITVCLCCCDNTVSISICEKLKLKS